MSITFTCNQTDTDPVFELFRKSGASFSLYVQLITNGGQLFRDRQEAKMLKTSSSTAELSEDLWFLPAVRDVCVTHIEVYDSSTSDAGTRAELQLTDKNLSSGDVLQFRSRLTK